MSWEAWLTLIVIAATIVGLVLDVTAPAGIVLGAVVVLLVTSVLEPAEAFAGFSNPAPLTVAALYVVAAGIERTGILNGFVDGVVGGRGRRGALGRLLAPSAAASAVLNNTPIVAMLVPPVARWADRVGLSAGRILMPLSFAAILGGMVTVVGTSTNVVVSGLLVESGMESFGFFEVAKLGLPVAAIGLTLLVFVGPVLLPPRRPARSDIGDAREYTIEMVVVAGGPIDGATVHDAQLRHLAGVFLVQVERDHELLGAVGPDHVLRGDDILRFVGNVMEATDLQQRTGLVTSAKAAGGIPPGPMAFFEAVIGTGSPLVGRSLRDVGFRQRYRAAVLAIHRADQRVLGKLGDTRFKVGDTLLVLAPVDFARRWMGAGDFLLVSRLGDEPIRFDRKGRAIGVGLAVVASSALGLLPILDAALLGAFSMVLIGVLSVGDARRAVNLDVVVLIAASFGLSGALAKTGLAAEGAEFIVGAFDGVGQVVVLVVVALVTILLTEVVTNTGAAVLMFPIAMAAAGDVGSDPRAFAAVVALAASASFLTPIGYQTNTMVWAPGGYRYWDYARLGLPLTGLTLGVVAIAAPLWWVL